MILQQGRGRGRSAGGIILSERNKRPKRHLHSPVLR
uniref:Uncharacterized protein n=1 Tax=Arundo donax TaxID=35708 RepID=A0A0A9CFK1_ARUDO